MTTRKKRKARICPICGNGMAFFHGCLADHDSWYCVVTIHPQNGRSGCGHEIELNTTTCPEEDDNLQPTEK